MSVRALIATGTKVWLDSVDPQSIRQAYDMGVTGATSNPIIIADIIKRGERDDQLAALMDQGLDDQAIAWQLTDQLVREAQQVFLPVWDQRNGNDGYVSFELDPLLEDRDSPLPQSQRTQRYIELGRQWFTASDLPNRMIKVPATAAGLDALEELAAAGVTINVTLCFTPRQYTLARDAIWRGAQRRRDGLADFKSVYSIFVSRVDVYTAKHVPQLSPEAQGLVGIVNAKRLWQLNQEFWQNKAIRLRQEIIFASTGTKNPSDAPDKYVEALAGGDIQTDPPETLEAVERLHRAYRPQLREMPAQHVLEEIDREVDVSRMEQVLMDEGTEKFAKPMKGLLSLIADKRRQLAAARHGVEPQVVPGSTGQSPLPWSDRPTPEQPPSPRAPSP